MTYRAAYEYLLSLNNLPRREYLSDPRHCGVYLKRMVALLALFGHPERRIPHYLHVTGTSGKGSVARMLASIWRASGARVGLLTSPHPSAIGERWEVDGRPMDRPAFAGWVAQLKNKLEQYIRRSPYDVPSFSELTTILALCHFAQARAEWVVLEAGCGGRYDATNIIPHKEAAIITNVGLDHTEILGNTKPKIAYEKAGIIKRGVRVFTAETNPRVLAVIARECRRTSAALIRVRASEGEVIESDLSGSRFLAGKECYRLSVIGAHQVGNALLARRAALDLGVPEAAVKQGLARVRLPVCCEVVSRRPLIILDGAHNPDKMRTTVEAIEQIQQIQYPADSVVRRVHLVLGFAANKDIRAMLKQLAALRPATVACTRFTNNILRKAASPAMLARQCRLLFPRTKIELFLEPTAALSWSQRQQKHNDLLLVTGSIFLSGQLRKKFKKN
ncbi:MAG: hypothetical protein HYV42_00480 [Candidatus Magasanikbacteria bacterium]|nr:hypothetical protein [Candidatus Magasanikbacteria bacterium]